MFDENPEDFKHCQREEFKKELSALLHKYNCEISIHQEREFQECGVRFEGSGKEYQFFCCDYSSWLDGNTVQYSTKDYFA